MLETWEFGLIKVVADKDITSFDTYIRDDVLGEWSFYQLADDGSIVAVHNWED